MSGKRTKKTFIVAALVCATFQPAHADDASFNDPARLFPTCAGRLYALMEHQWTVDPKQAEITQTSYIQFNDLAAAIVTPQNGTEIRNLRVQSRVSFRNLLERDYFGTDTDNKTWATQRISYLIGECKELLLS